MNSHVCSFDLFSPQHILDPCMSPELFCGIVSTCANGGSLHNKCQQNPYISVGVNDYIFWYCKDAAYFKYFSLSPPPPLDFLVPCVHSC